MRKISWESMHIDDIEENSDIVDEDDIPEEEMGEFIPLAGKLINTPMGLFDVDDKYNPLRQFELRIGYTNFDITAEAADIIESSPGVEAFAVLTRYRFIIGIGKLFTFETVRKEIEKNLLDKPLGTSLVEASKNINKNKAYWALYQFPNGEVSTLETDSKDEYDKRVELYREAEALSGGELLTSEEL